MLLGGSAAGTNEYINAAVAGRLATDPPGTLRPPILYTSATTAFNADPEAAKFNTRRWGDYSNISLDPCDDMTMWAIQQFTVTTNVWGVAVARVKAPPPPSVVVRHAARPPSERGVGERHHYGDSGRRRRVLRPRARVRVPDQRRGHWGHPGQCRDVPLSHVDHAQRVDGRGVRCEPCSHGHQSRWSKRHHPVSDLPAIKSGRLRRGRQVGHRGVSSLEWQLVHPQVEYGLHRRRRLRVGRGC